MTSEPRQSESAVLTPCGCFRPDKYGHHIACELLPPNAPAALAYCPRHDAWWRNECPECPS